MLVSVDDAAGVGSPRLSVHCTMQLGQAVRSFCTGCRSDPGRGEKVSDHGGRGKLSTLTANLRQNSQNSKNSKFTPGFLG